MASIYILGRVVWIYSIQFVTYPASDGARVHVDLWPLAIAPRLSKGFIAQRLGIPNVEVSPSACLIEAIPYNSEHICFHLFPEALALDGRLWGVAGKETDCRKVANGYTSSLKICTMEVGSMANVSVLFSSLYILARIIFLKHSFVWVILQLRITPNYAQLAMWDKAHSDYLGFQNKLSYQPTCLLLHTSCLLCWLDYSSWPLCCQASEETSRRPAGG